MIRAIAFAFYVFFICVWPGATFGQIEKWENSLASRHVIATINLNVSRLCETYQGSDVLEDKKSYFLNQKKLNLDDVDQFQAIMCLDPALGFGADDNSHTQLSFLRATKLDAQVIGELSSYRVTEVKIGSWKAFVGRKKNEGSWGAIPVNDRSLVFGVTRMLESIVESQEMVVPDAHKIEELRKDVEICITISGGKRTAKMFENAWGFFQDSCSEGARMVTGVSGLG